jgi:hypothetical protein
MSNSNLSAVTKTGDDDAIAGRTRVAAIYYTCGSTASSFQLKNGATTAAISALAPGTYNVTVTDKNNCTSTKAVFLPYNTPSITHKDNSKEYGLVSKGVATSPISSCTPVK